MPFPLLRNFLSRNPGIFRCFKFVLIRGIEKCRISAKGWSVCLILKGDAKYHFLKRYLKNIKQTENLVIAWDTFSEESPGVSKKIELDGKDVYSIIEDFKDWGIYLAERRIDE